MSVKQSQIERTANAVLAGYNSWDLEAIMAPRAPNCTQQVIPSSLNRPILNNDEYREFFAGVVPWFKNFKVQILSMIIDEKQAKVCIHAKSSAETVLGAYGNEYSLFLTMTEDHKEVVQILEFVDSKYSDDFFARLRAHREKQGLEK